MVLRGLLTLLTLMNIALCDPGYNLVDMKQTSWGMQGTLNRVDGPQLYDTPIPTLHVEIVYTSPTICRIRVTDKSADRWEVPYVYVGPWREESDADLQYNVTYSATPFSLQIVRGGDVIFTMEERLVYEDHYLEFSSKLADNPNVYGLGERVSDNFRLRDNKYVMFSRDKGAYSQGEGVYGVHPMYMELSEESGAHGVFLMNSNALMATLSGSKLTWQTTGGILDIFVMTGPFPMDVSSQYSTIVGSNMMPPIWGLGWFQSRWGVANLDELKQIVQNFTDNKLPLDVVVSDLDYMDGRRDFSFDQENYPANEMVKFVQDLHSSSKRWMPITDPGISCTSTDYAPYTDGLDQGVFIRSNSADEEPIRGKQWPGHVVWPDFFHTNASQYWTQQYSNMYANVPFDASWIDMNEVDSMCNGSCDDDDMIDPNVPPFNPVGERLDSNSIDMAARHVTFMSGSDTLTEYDAHSLYAYMQANKTYEAMASIHGTRPFILSRATFAGSGRSTNHWTGDNGSDWPDLRWSITGIMNMNLFQIQMTGSDICGFGKNTTRELCARWINLGTLYPFCRSHNSIGQRLQEPYVFDEEFTEMSRTWMRRRLTLLPYLYTSMYQSHVYGYPLFRALLFNFPLDKKVWDIDTQFMLGPAVLATPVLLQGTTVTGFMPACRWYAWDTFEEVKGGRDVTFDAPLETLPMHYRGGQIVILQPAINDPLSVMDAMANPYTVNVALDEDGNAQGIFYHDDGQSIDSIEAGEYSLIEFDAVDGHTFTSKPIVDAFHVKQPLTDVNIIGLEKKEWIVEVNGKAWSSFKFDGNTLYVTNLELSLDDNVTITWK